jgi:hypothetical protein
MDVKHEFLNLGEFINDKDSYRSDTVIYFFINMVKITSIYFIKDTLIFCSF